MTPIYLIIAIPVLLLLTFAEIAYDNWKQQKRFSIQDTLTNISCGIGNQGINLFTEVLKLFLFIDIFYTKLAFFHLPFTWWSVILCLLIFDLAFYWEHRLSHTINILWGTHVVHHSSEEYNLSIALRRSWLADIVVIVFFLPIPMMGFSPETFLSVVIIHNFYQYILHTKAIDKMPSWYSFFMHTPSHHRVHHGRDPKYIDKNFSGVFIIYDRIFGTFKKEEEEPTYGITTQLKTNNPAEINLHYYRDLFKLYKKIPGRKNKLRLLFAKPGWLPEEMGGYQAAPVVDKSVHKKYNAATPNKLNQYILAQFLVNFVAILALLLSMKLFKVELPELFKIFSFVWIAMSSIIPIALFDRQASMKPLEYIRLATGFVVATAFAFMYMPSLAILLSVVSLVYFAAMAWWFTNVSKKYMTLEVESAPQPTESKARVQTEKVFH